MNDTYTNSEATPPPTPIRAPEPAEFDPENLAELDELAEEGIRTNSHQGRSMDAAKEIIKKAWTNGIPATRIADKLSRRTTTAKAVYTTVNASTVSRYCKKEFGSRHGKKTGRKGGGSAPGVSLPPGAP